MQAFNGKEMQNLLLNLLSTENYTLIEKFEPSGFYYTGIEKIFVEYYSYHREFDKVNNYVQTYSMKYRPRNGIIVELPFQYDDSLYYHKFLYSLFDLTKGNIEKKISFDTYSIYYECEKLSLLECYADILTLTSRDLIESAKIDHTTNKMRLELNENARPIHLIERPTLMQK